MINLITDTAAQTIYLTLDEGRQYYSETFTDYLIILTREENAVASGLDLAQVATILEDNQRYTQLQITTVGLNNSGRYRYEVYGQNSAVNTNPNDAVVVGLIERGLCSLTDSTEYFSTTNTTVPDDVQPDQ